MTDTYKKFPNDQDDDRDHRIVLVSLIVVLVGAVVALIVGVVWQRISPGFGMATTTNATTSATNTVELLSDGCDHDRCIIQGPDRPVGYGWMEGYYETREQTRMDQESVVCDVLHVTDANRIFLDHYRDLVRNGNTINETTGEGNLLLTISLTDLPVQEQQLIRASSETSTIQIQVLQKEIQPRGVDACYSFVDVIDVQRPE